MACSDSDYAYLRGIVMAESANRIDPSRNALFDTRLTPIARMSGATSLEDFVHMLKSSKPAHLHRAVAEAMTINETSFFRDIAPFEMLREVVLPELIAKQKRTAPAADMERGQFDGAGGVQRGDVDCRAFSGACALGREDYWDGYLAAGGGLCAERPISAIGGEPRPAGADAAEVYGARWRRVGGCARGFDRCASSGMRICARRCRSCRCLTWCC